jgi:hypothetical protein
MDWTTPVDIRNQLERQWSNGRILTARLSGESLFPFVLATKKPGPADLAERFDEVRSWIKELENGSKHQIGFGYEIEWTIRNHRQLGRNKVPTRLVVSTESDALCLLNRSADARSFHDLAERILKAFPGLRMWVIRHPLIVLEHAADWGLILDVLAWFCSNPMSGLYLRQVEAGGVDTKFIEDRKALFLELLDLVRNPETSDERPETVRTFEQRFGLLQKAPMIRFRLLDESLYIQGLSDLAVPCADFARLAPNATTVFITENEINGLAFPNVPASLVIFGLGYGLERLGQAMWLTSKRIYYWGDIDTHGFAMLDRLRSLFPDARSLLMDRETLMRHRDSWVKEGEPYDRPLGRLTGDEQALFEDLRRDRFGCGVRLEQERISFSRVVHALQELHVGDVLPR